jgi:hypothetical protein
MLKHLLTIQGERLFALYSVTLKDAPAVVVLRYLNDRLGGHAADPGAGGSCYSTVDQDKAFASLTYPAQGVESGTAGTDDCYIYFSLLHFNLQKIAPLYEVYRTSQIGERRPVNQGGIYKDRVSVVVESTGKLGDYSGKDLKYEFYMKRLVSLLLIVVLSGMATKLAVAGDLPESANSETQEVKINDKDVPIAARYHGKTVGDEATKPKWTQGMPSQGEDLPVNPEPINIAGLDEQEKQPDYVGTWRQTALYVGGSPHEFSAASMTLRRDDFTSTSTCTVQGTVAHAENTLMLVTTSTNCRGVPIPLTVSYSYEISEDNTTLSWSTPNHSETFVREK